MFKGLVGSLFLLLCVVLSGVCQGKDFDLEEKTLSKEEEIAIGRGVYRQGILSDGEPVEAFVMGDIKVLGSQFTCLNCHGRSGMGGAEGKTFTLAINPAALFSPRESVYLKRSAYDAKTLEIAIRQGETPEGTALSPAMPVYHLPDLEMNALLGYLKTLSSEFSSGLTDEELHIATVVGDTADPVAKAAMLAVIEGFFKDKNARTRNEDKRVDRGPFYQHYRLKAYRRWKLHIWELHGAPETWRVQLKEYYEKQKVFAMLGGVIQGDWAPIHSFCEELEIPALFPNTDQPGGIGTDDFYTLYFSEGMHLEARVLAADIAGQNHPVNVLQIYRSGQEGAFAADAFRETAGQIAGVFIADWDIEKGTNMDGQELFRRVKEAGAEEVIFWLFPKDLEGVNFKGLEQLIAGHSYLSSSLLGGIFTSVPETLGKRAKLIHPFLLREEQESVFRRVQVWLQGKKIPITNRRILGQTYYACMMMGEGFMHIKRHFYRDYLMDALDHGNAKSIFSVNYPRLSYGPGQRYLAKGAFVIKNPGSTGKNARSSATWIVPHLQ